MARSRSLRRRSMAVVVVLGTLVGGLIGVTIAWALFSATSAAEANSFTAGSVAAGHQPTATVSGRDVSLSWGAVSTATGYTVARSNVSPQSLATSEHGSCASSVAGLSCTDTGVVESGTVATNWTYSDTPQLNNWQGAASPASTTVVVPGPSLSLGATSFTVNGSTTNAVVANFFDNEGITYCVDQSSSCSAGNTLGTDTVPASGGTTTTASITIPAGLAVGSHTVYAIGSLGSLPSESITITKASPAVTASGPANGTDGTAIPTTSISSVFGSSSGSNATGTIIFTVFGPQTSAPTTCTSGGTSVGTATVSGNSTYHPSAGFTPTQGGDYWWYASYGGDANNNTAASICGSGMSETGVVDTVTESAAGSYALTVPAGVTSFGFTMNGAGGGASDAGLGSSANGGAGGQVSGTITIPSSGTATTFTVVVGGAGAGSSSATGGTGGTSGTGCAAGGAGAVPR